MSLGDTVRHELARAAAGIPIAGVDLDQTMARGRRIRRRKMVANLGVAVVLVAAAGAAVLVSSPSSEQPFPPADKPTETVPEETPEETGEQVSPDFGRIEPVLRQWLAAIRASDEDAAWALMTPEAQELVGRDEFDRMMLSELPEGLGAFAEAESFHYVVVDSGGREAVVVGVVSGEVTREATTEFAAMPIPLRIDGDEVLVDDGIVDRARYYDRVAVFASASLGPQRYRSGDELIVEFARPKGAADVVIAVDDERRAMETEFDPAAGRAAATLEHDLEQGTHIATVIVVHESGRLYPEAILFEAAQP